MLFWQGCNKGTVGVGVFNAERWIDSVVDVVRVNERIVYVKLMIGKQFGKGILSMMTWALYSMQYSIVVYTSHG